MVGGEGGRVTDKQGRPTMQTTYTVSGMTCDHCVNAVGTEIGRLDGVNDVRVDLTTGAVVVTSERQLDEQAVAAAIDEAGYALVGPAADRTG
jgi:copper chaperone